MTAEFPAALGLAQFVIEFLLAYLPKRRLRVLDPYATTPLHLMALSQEGRLRTAAIRGSDLNLIRFRHLAASMPEVDETAGLQVAVDEGSADLVLCFPPIGEKRKRASVSVHARTTTLNDEAPLHQVLGALAALKADSEAIVLVRSATADDLREHRLRGALGELGFHLNGVIEVVNAFSHAKGIETSLLFITRRPTQHLFVGRLDDDTDAHQLAANLRRASQGRTAELGRLLAPGESVSIRRLIAKEQFRQLGAKAGLKPRPLQAFLAEPLGKPLKAGETWDDKPNAVYLPTFAGSPVWTRLEELTSVPHGYLQLVLDPHEAIAEYIGAFLRSPLGLAVRESISSRGALSTIRRSELAQMPVFAPPVVEQRECVSVRRSIGDMRLQLDELERRLVSHPRAAKKVRREVQKLNERDGFGSWVQTLPFPLGSIADAYRAAGKATPARKKEALLRLFEGTAEFACAVLLSGFRGSDTWTEFQRRWLAGKEADTRMSLAEASFGTWCVLGSRVAGTTRELLSDPKNRSSVLGLFHLTTPTLLAGLCSKDLWKTLNSALVERNREAVHGSVSSDLRDLEQLERLEALLDEYRRVTADTFEDAILFRPGPGALRSGIYHYDRATMLMGGHPTFREEPRFAKVGLEADEVYLAEDVDIIAGALQLAPFVRFLDAPKGQQNACWFYSRVINGKPVFVSHHYSADPVPHEDAALLGWLAELSAGPSP